MSKKLLIIVPLLMLIGGIFWITSSKREVAIKSTEKDLQESLAPEIKAILDKKISLIETLLEDPVIVNNLRKANEEQKGLSLDEIMRLDKRWRESKGVDDFIRPFLSNEVALKLLEFQEANPGFSEIFITGERGVNVGQTNKTTDYYQADEDWWVEAYNSGKGKASHGPIEFDESARVEAISLYVPIMDTSEKKAIGVAKAVLHITAIKSEL